MLENHGFRKCFSRFRHQAHRGHCGCSIKGVGVGDRLHLKLATDSGSLAYMVLVSQACTCKSYRVLIAYIKIPESHESQAVCSRVRFHAMGLLRANE